jgi:integral membrane protein
MHAAVLRYRVMAFITGCLIIIVVFVGIPLQIWAHNTIITNQVATVHGVLYMVYIVFAFILANKLHLKPKPTVILLLAGTVPVMTFIVERWMTRRYINPALAEQSPEAAPVSS